MFGYQLIMTRALGARLARLLAVMAVTLQVLLPGSMAVAGAKGGDLSGLMCAPSGGVSAESRAATERLAALLGEDPPDETPADEHCAPCTPPYVGALNDRTLVAVPCRFITEVEHVIHQPGLVHRAQGPPVGSRAPPPRS